MQKSRKMAGGFRTAKGREMYCNILSIIEIIKRRKMNKRFIREKNV